MLHLFDQNTVQYYDFFLNVTYSCDGKAKFLTAITPVFSVTRSFRNHSIMLIGCSRNIYYYQRQKQKDISFDGFISVSCLDVILKKNKKRLASYTAQLFISPFFPILSFSLLKVEFILTLAAFHLCQN